MHPFVIHLGFALLIVISAGCQPDATNTQETPDMQAEAQPIDMDCFAWKNRPVLIFGPGPNDPRIQQQRDRLSQVEEGLAERDIVVIEVFASGNVSVEGQPAGPGSGDRLREQFGVSNDDFAVLLIGKDTGVKLRRDEPVQVQTLFDLIDAMPMRQREMRGRE